MSVKPLHPHPEIDRLLTKIDVVLVRNEAKNSRRRLLARKGA